MLFKRKYLYKGQSDFFQFFFNKIENLKSEIYLVFEKVCSHTTVSNRPSCLTIKDRLSKAIKDTIQYLGSDRFYF